MFPRPLNSFLVLVLTGTLAVSACVPTTGACQVNDHPSGKKRCCGRCCQLPNRTEQSCCHTAKASQVCHCSAEDPRPAAPPERQSSETRGEFLLAKSVTAVVIVIDGSQRELPGDTTLFSSQPGLRRQAILCRWLT